MTEVEVSRMVELLKTALRDSDSGVRSAAVVALSGWGNPRATEPLLAVLNDEVPLVRQHAVAALSYWETLTHRGASR